MVIDPTDRHSPLALSLNPYEVSEGTKVRVNYFPTCETERHRLGKHPALFRGRTRRGEWLYMCDRCFESMGVGLGVDRGHMLEVRT